MAKRIIEITAGYNLVAEQGLLSQEPFSTHLPGIYRRGNLDRASFNGIILGLAKANNDDQLPVIYPERPSIRAKGYYRALFDILKHGDVVDQPAQYVLGVAILGLALREIPEYLKYLRDNHESPPYNITGDWITEYSTTKTQKGESGEKVSAVIRPVRLDAARSYAYWEYKRQKKLPETPLEIVRQQTLSDANVAGLLTGNNETAAVTPRRWLLLNQDSSPARANVPTTRFEELKDFLREQTHTKAQI